MGSIPRGNLALNGDRFLEPVKKLLVKKSATQLKVESKCGGKRNIIIIIIIIIKFSKFGHFLFFFREREILGKDMPPFILFYFFSFFKKKSLLAIENL